MSDPDESRGKETSLTKKTSTSLVHLLIPIAFAAFWMYMRLSNMKTPASILTVSSDEPESPLKRSLFPVTRGVCIFISDAATGVGREAALLLADSGVHVLAGVKTDGEMRSFIFDSRKGLEPILFDHSDQNTLLKVVNRVKQIRFDLNRRFLGTLINVADLYEEYPMQEKERLGGDVDSFDATLRTLVKEPYRLLQATVALLSDPANKLEIPEALKYNKEIHSQNKKKKDGKEEKNENGVKNDSDINSVKDIVNGGRIVFMSSNNFQAIVQGCGFRCMHQSTINAISKQLSIDMAPRNISVSSIIMKYEKMNFNEEIVERKEPLNIGKIDKYRYNKRKASPKVLKKELEDDIKKEKEKLHKNRLVVAEEEMNDRLKWDLEIVQDEIEIECRKDNNDKKCIEKKKYSGIDDKEGKKILKKRNSLNSAKAVVHSLLSNHPLLEYNL